MQLAVSLMKVGPSSGPMPHLLNRGPTAKLAFPARTAAAGAEGRSAVAALLGGARGKWKSNKQ